MIATRRLAAILAADTFIVSFQAFSSIFATHIMTNIFRYPKSHQLKG
jgi:hypothetical protein